MKQPVLIYCVLLGLATSLAGQTPASPAPREPQGKPAKASAAKAYPLPTRLPPELTNQERFHDVTLEPGTLREVVQQLDEVYSQVQRSNGPVEYNMPNLVWSQETMELPVPAPLRLFEVNAVDGLALIAAAAGCRLEPIESPQADAKEKRIIGYKFVRAQMGNTMVSGNPPGEFGMMAAGRPSMVGLAAGGGMGAARVVTPGDPFGPATMTFQTRTGPGMPVSSAITTVTSSSSSAPSPGNNLRELQAQLVRLQQTLGDEHPQIVALKRQLEAAEQVNVQLPVTRVYAMVGILSGPGDKDLTVKLSRMKESIYNAASGDGVKEKDIQISYHDGTNILVIRAPEAAQNLIAQVIEALRENAKGGKP